MRQAHQKHHRICLVSYSIWFSLSPIFASLSIHELSSPLIGGVWQAFRLLFLSTVVADSNIRLLVEHEQSHGHSTLWQVWTLRTFSRPEKQPAWLHAKHLLNYAAELVADNYAVELIVTSCTSELENFIQLHCTLHGF